MRALDGARAGVFILGLVLLIAGIAVSVGSFYGITHRPKTYEGTVPSLFFVAYNNITETWTPFSGVDLHETDKVIIRFNWNCKILGTRANTTFEAFLMDSAGNIPKRASAEQSESGELPTLEVVFVVPYSDIYDVQVRINHTCGRYLYAGDSLEPAINMEVMRQWGPDVPLLILGLSLLALGIVAIPTSFVMHRKT